MHILINGIQRKVPNGLTIAELLEREGEPIGHVVVELNGQFVPAKQYLNQVIAPGDQVELILPAFGG